MDGTGKILYRPQVQTNGLHSIVRGMEEVDAYGGKAFREIAVIERDLGAQEADYGAQEYQDGEEETEEERHPVPDPATAPPHPATPPPQGAETWEEVR